MGAAAAVGFRRAGYHPPLGAQPVKVREPRALAVADLDSWMRQARPRQAGGRAAASRVTAALGRIDREPTS